MAKYFLHGANGTAVATEDAVNLNITANETFEFLNYVTALSFRTEFSLGEAYEGLQKFHIILTDVKNQNKVLKFTYVFEDNGAYFYVNDKEENKVSVRSRKEGDLGVMSLEELTAKLVEEDKSKKV